MQGVSFSGNLFFDPLVPGLSGAAERGPARAAADTRRRGTQTAAEQNALRAASLVKVRKDLEHMIRDRAR
ncbi:hypothetical protein [Pseudarthrobacter sp. NamE5]|uniref:hypothetical protein n=1 Tax=Pseudarthrobacter sp. NamE5 TaxID=2576839 RepID=UPI00110C14E8|nr:hypothetical protein [Pseudarthrobacter sp. NamE5]TLM88061.1 hypothetical protein FDW84_00595 [Pseudarthrobacter sp. NamE5]